jgi:hypothetical protein
MATIARRVTNLEAELRRYRDRLVRRGCPGLCRSCRVGWRVGFARSVVTHSEAS